MPGLRLIFNEKMLSSNGLFHALFSQRIEPEWLLSLPQVVM
jgi:hypothetical protein